MIASICVVIGAQDITSHNRIGKGQKSTIIKEEKLKNLNIFSKCNPLIVHCALGTEITQTDLLTDIGGAGRDYSHISRGEENYDMNE